MTERPEKTSDSQQEGWHTPATPNLWQPPKQAPQVVLYSVEALPKEMSQEPDSKGGWHLPRPEDTVFNAGDQIEVEETSQATVGATPAILRPEDLIAEITGQRIGQEQRTEAARPEDFTFAYEEDEDDTEPGDAVDEDATMLIDEETGMSNLEALGALDDDDEAISMSELVALASLAEGMDTGEINTQNINAEDLSPAERVLFSKAAEADRELPSDFGATQTLSDTSQQAAQEGKSAAEIAAEMANQVSQPDYGAGFGHQGQQQQAQQQQQEPALSPEQEELAAKFRETQRQVGVLRQRYEQGQIDYQQLQSELQSNSILDPDGNWWMLGYESDQWFRFNNATNQWDAAEPPVPLDGRSPATQTGTGGMPQVLDGGSLPYIEGDGGTIDIAEHTQDYDDSQYSEAQQRYNQEYGFQAGHTPIPNPDEPANDPNLTMVGPSAYTENLPGAQPTVQNLNMVEGYDPQQTMPSAGVYDEQSIGGMTQQSASTYDDAEQYQQEQYHDTAPTYDDDEGVPEIYAQQAGRQGQRLRNIIIAGVFVILACSIVSAVSFFAYAAYWYDQTVEPYRAQILALANYQPDFQIARVMDASGAEIMTLTSQDGAREPVRIEGGEVSPFFVHAVVSSEDPTYYENPGLNIFSIARAFWQNLTAGEIQSGASTITQQIASNLVLEDRSQTAERKAIEIAVALEIANTYSKNEVLDIYINEFPFGNQTFGVEAASQLYFGIPASDLDMAQSALLAGLLPAPGSSNPVQDREAAFDAMNVVIDRMIRTDCLNFQHSEWADGASFCINENTLVDGNRLFQKDSSGVIGGLLALQIAQVETRNYSRRDAEFIYPHFRNYVVERIEAEFGSNALYQRGFTIYTTLIPVLQEGAEAQLASGVDGLSLNGVNTGAVIVLDPTSGAIRALVGSPDFNDEGIDGQVDNTRTWQQPGSAIKPIVYTAALSGGNNGYLTPASILWDVPSEYAVAGGGVYRPVNFDGRFRGPVSVRTALAQSLNIPAVKVFEFIGADAFQNTGRAMGLGFLDDSTFGLPTALGANEVRLLDMAEAFGTLAADGIFHQAYVIERITENINGEDVDVSLEGTSLGRQAPQQVVTPQVAYLMQSILSDDNARAAQFGANGALSGASLGLPNQNYLAAKTGTSNDSRDMWTIGFTNNWVVGVWMGTVDNSPTTGNLTGSRAAAPIWNFVMREALRISGNNPGAFDPPPGIREATVCLLTGSLAPNPADCPTERVAERFAEAQPPPQIGFVQTLQIDSWTGLRANLNCPSYQIAETFSNINDPFATNWLNTTSAGQQILNVLGLTDGLSASPVGECQQGQTIPSIDMISPPVGSTVQAVEIFTITGQINASDLQRWELEYAPVGSETWTPIIQPSTQQVQRGAPLGEWDTTLVSNNTYRLRLVAYSQSGGTIFREATVQVQNILPTPTPIPTTIPPTPTIFGQDGFTPIPFGSTPTATVAP